MVRIMVTVMITIIAHYFLSIIKLRSLSLSAQLSLLLSLQRWLRRSGSGAGSLALAPALVLALALAQVRGPLAAALEDIFCLCARRAAAAGATCGRQHRWYMREAPDLLTIWPLEQRKEGREEGRGRTGSEIGKEKRRSRGRRKKERAEEVEEGVRKRCMLVGCDI
jgi:hypothetical protein